MTDDLEFEAVVIERAVLADEEPAPERPPVTRREPSHDMDRCEMDEQRAWKAGRR